MKLLVTGAGGFLGRCVVAAAVRRGHSVRSLVRPASREVPESWLGHPQVEVVRGDLRCRHGLSSIVEGVDTVIHAAAAKAGDLYEQFAGTVIATENLLGAMETTGVRHLVAISSFAVYEYLRRRSWSILDESSPLAIDPHHRDGYTQTKLFQEHLIREFTASSEWRTVILRPGCIFGRGELWPGRVGMHLGAGWRIRTGAFARVPLTYVENCADAVVLSAEYDGPEQPLILNVVDSDTPSVRAYTGYLKKRCSDSWRVVPAPWPLLRLAARLASLTNAVLFGGTAKVPGLFVPARLHAVSRPLRYPNAKALTALDWVPRFSWREGIDRSISDVEPAALPPVRQARREVTRAAVQMEPST